MNQEIYVKEMPKSCVCCKFFAQHRRQCEINLGFEWNEEKQKYNDCPLIDIKTHDRELVKEVCEKIREYLRTQVIYCGGKATELDIMIASAGNQVLEDIKQFLDQIQKEYEK